MFNVCYFFWKPPHLQVLPFTVDSVGTFAFFSIVRPSRVGTPMPKISNGALLTFLPEKLNWRTQFSKTVIKIIAFYSKMTFSTLIIDVIVEKMPIYRYLFCTIWVGKA